MAVTKIGSKWSSGSLVFFDKATGDSLMTFNPSLDGIEIVVPMYVGDGTNRFSVTTDGTVRLSGNATAWKDMVGNLLGQRLNSTSGKVDYDWDDNCLTFNSGGSLAVAADRVQWNQQIDHQYKVGEVTFKPHVHYFQAVSSGAITPFVLSLQYRLQRNGSAKTTDWTTITCTSGTDDIYDYSASEDDTYCQIAVFDDIEVECGLSDTLQFRMARTDSETGDMQVYFVDLHGEVDSFGSDTQYGKE